MYQLIHFIPWAFRYSVQMQIQCPNAKVLGAALFRLLNYGYLLWVLIRSL